jgi:hypothetical protein
MPQTINAKSLLKQAKDSEHKEAYQNINKTNNCRIGAGARLSPAPQPPIFFIEIIINLCPTCSKADLEYLERTLNCLKKLQENNYTLTCQDGNSIMCEKLVNEKTLQAELKDASSIVEKL